VVSAETPCHAPRRATEEVNQYKTKKMMFVCQSSLSVCPPCAATIGHIRARHIRSIHDYGVPECPACLVELYVNQPMQIPALSSHAPTLVDV